MSYVIYVDGSAHPNPGPGGYGIVIFNETGQLLSVYSRQYTDAVTNNEMELKGILYTMLHFGKEQNAIVYSDSNYAVQTLNNWMFSWQKKGWIKSDKKPPENLDIIKAYYDLYMQGYRIQLSHIKGHVGTIGNEIADQLATGKMSSEEAMHKYGCL